MGLQILYAASDKGQRIIIYSSLLGRIFRRPCATGQVGPMPNSAEWHVSVRIRTTRELFHTIGLSEREAVETAADFVSQRVEHSPALQPQQRHSDNN